MNKKISSPGKLIIYDLDGTLIDSRLDIAHAVNWTLKEIGFKELSMEQISHFVGSGVKNLMQGVLREAGAKRGQAPFDAKDSKGAWPLLSDSIKLFRRRYGEHLLEHTRLYPSVLKVLECLKIHKQAVVTNKPENFSLTILKGLGIESYFFQVVGGDTGFPKKPVPEGVLNILKQAGVRANQAILVGDSALDIETAKNAGIRVAAVTYGFGKRDEIKQAKPDWIWEDLEELIECPLLKER